MNVAIVGGSGLIGRRLARHLAERGDGVTIVSRRPDAVQARLPTGARAVGWTPGDAAELARALRGIDVVVNLAGVSIGPRPWTPSRRRAILESRLVATRTIVAALVALPTGERPAVLVSASGTDTYTGQDAVPVTEDAPVSSDFLAGVCVAWEAEAVRARELGVRVAIVRTGFVLASDAKALALYALPFRLHLGGPIASGQQWMSWIHVDDVVGLYVLAIDDRRLDGIMNAVGPEPARQEEVAAAIGAALRRRSWLRVPAWAVRRSWLRVPAWAVRLALQGQAILPLGSRRVLPARALELGYGFAWTDLRAAVRDVLGT